MAAEVTVAVAVTAVAMKDMVVAVTEAAQGATVVVAVATGEVVATKDRRALSIIHWRYCAGTIIFSSLAMLPEPCIQHVCIISCKIKQH